MKDEALFILAKDSYNTEWYVFDIIFCGFEINKTQKRKIMKHHLKEWNLKNQKIIENLKKEIKLKIKYKYGNIEW